MKPDFHSHLAKLITIGFVTTLFLWGCSAPHAPTASAPRYIDLPPEEKAQQLIEQAEKKPKPEAMSLFLQAAELLLEENRFTEAQQLIYRVEYPFLTTELKARYIATRCQIALAMQDYDEALAILDSPHFNLAELASQLPLETRAEMAQIRIRIFEAKGDWLTVANLRLALADQLDRRSVRQNHEAIWDALLKVPVDSLRETRSVTSNPILAGWIELALIYNNPNLDLDQQVASIERWTSTHPDHPAAEDLPGNLSLLIQIARKQPRHIALLLPQEGKYAKVSRLIERGFMAAYYRARKDQRNTPTVSIYDTSRGNFLDSYQMAVQGGAEVIIGPLQKSNIRMLASYDKLPVPTLTLNSVKTAEPPANLYQFGLAPEDEANAIAHRATMEGFHHAAVIYPDSDWGGRIADHFSETWLSYYGNRVVSKHAYTGKADHSQAVKTLLNVHRSEHRKNQLQWITGQKLEFNPRRRQDIDFIFMLASPTDGQQIKPALNFYFAGDIPVFSTSHIHSGLTEPEKNKDLNGVQFVETPWLLDSTNPVAEYFHAVWPKSQAPAERLVALGADAYHLFPRLQLLQAARGATLHGSTGTLTLGNNQRIFRQLNWAYMKNGMARAMPIIRDRDGNAENKAATQQGDWAPD